MKGQREKVAAMHTSVKGTPSYLPTLAPQTILLTDRQGTANQELWWVFRQFAVKADVSGTSSISFPIITDRP